jgi:hypothetical protein
MKAPRRRNASLIPHHRTETLVRYSSLPARLIATVALIAACTVAARADAPATLKQALLTTMKLPTYHMTMVSPVNGTIEADVANPGRMHITMKNMEMIVIDGTMYMKQGGAWRKFPGVDIMKTQSNPLQALAANKDNFTVDDLGTMTIDGAALHAYRTTNVRTKSVGTVYVDGSMRIVRIEAGQMVMKMSKFGEPVTIAAPM